MRRKNEDSFYFSNSLVPVLLCVLRGQDYSISIAHILRYTHSAAVQNLQKLQKRGMLESYAAGSATKYRPNWGVIASEWIDFRLAETERTDDAVFRGIDYRMALGSGEKKKVKGMMKNKIAPLMSLKKDPRFSTFTKAYLEQIAGLTNPQLMTDRSPLILLSFKDIFGWFFDDYVCPHLLLSLGEDEPKSMDEKMQSLEPLFVNSLERFRTYEQYGAQVAEGIRKELNR
ncbi:MAG: hypothetical protein WC488_02890 [Candidatus Micrarchaeia archaeon]